MFDRSSVIIRNGKALDYSYVPERIVRRESQISALETLFRPLAMENRPCTASLYGGIGSGKTVTARRFAEDLSDYMAGKGRPVSVVYVNCRNVSETGVLLQLIRCFDEGFPSRGFSADEMARSLAQHLSACRRGMLVILDEADVLLKKGTTDLIYQLTRARTDETAPVSLIMISQTFLEPYLDEASRSSFRRSNVVRFDRYTEDELFDIVQARAEEALMPDSCPEDSLRQIAMASAEYGDARMAIELLDRAANIAEEGDKGFVTVEDVRAAKAMTFSFVTDSKLRELDVNRMLVLLAVARSMKSNLSVMSSVVEKSYAVACEEYGVPARKHTQFWKYLQSLEGAGVINLTASTADNLGKVILVSLPDIPSKVLAEKMTAMIEEALDGKVRSLLEGSGDADKVQRLPPLSGPLHEVRGAQGEEGDTQADRCLQRRQDRSRRIRREGQHGGPENPLVGVRSEERDRAARHNHRRGDRRIPSPERRHRQAVLRIQRCGVPSEVLPGARRDHGRDRSGIRHQHSVHVLRGFPQDAHERRGQIDRRQISGDRP